MTEEVTIDDPATYKHPFTVVSSHRLLPGDELMEYICQENNRDVRHLVGPAGRP
jgi:phosphoribosylcarboxyaminoimidazole (NCAIR) mutase